MWGQRFIPITLSFPTTSGCASCYAPVAGFKGQYYFYHLMTDSWNVHIKVLNGGHSWRNGETIVLKVNLIILVHNRKQILKIKAPNYKNKFKGISNVEIRTDLRTHDHRANSLTITILTKTRNLPDYYW